MQGLKSDTKKIYEKKFRESESILATSNTITATEESLM